MKRVIIVGGGMSGLVANYVFNQYEGVDVKVLELGDVGGDFLRGGLKYIHRSEEMTAMMGDLKMVYSNFTIRGAIMLRDEVRPYPKVLEEMDAASALRVRYDHYRKTRRQEPGEFGEKAMNDPESVSSRRAIRCDFPTLVKLLAERATVVKGQLARILHDKIITSNGNSHPFDYLVVTIPLWVLREVAYFPLPEAHAMRMNLARVRPIGDPFARWDYVYTPYTPEDAIHRVSHNGEGVYTCEINGVYDAIKAASDLNFIFKDGYEPLSITEGLKGHLLPLPFRPDFPIHIAPLGRFAKWDPRSTQDVVLSDARALANDWGWRLKDGQV
jgi:hypothetical protein